MLLSISTGGKTLFISSFVQLTDENVREMGVEDSCTEMLDPDVKVTGHDLRFISLSFYNSTRIVSGIETNGFEMLLVRFIYRFVFHSLFDTNFIPSCFPKIVPSSNN